MSEDKMLRIELYNWAGDRKAKEALAECGYEHQQVIERRFGVSDLVDELLATGINVMVFHSGKQGGVDFVVAVDSKHFGQR